MSTLSQYNKASSTEPHLTPERGPTFFIILTELWNGRYIIGATVAALLAITIVFVRLSRAEYLAQAAVQLKYDQSNTLGARFYALTGQENPHFEKFELILRSYLLAREINRNHNVAKILFSEEWNPATNSWHPPRSLRFKIRKVLAPLFGLSAWHPPSTDEIQEYLANNLSIVRASNTSRLVLLSLKYPRRHYAKELLSWVIDGADQISRDRELRNDTIEYKALSNALAGNRNSVKNAAQSQLISKLSDLDAKRLILKSGAPYEFQILDPVRVDKYPVSKRLPFLISVSIFVGIILGSVFVFIWNSIKLSYASYSRLSYRLNAVNPPKA